MADSHSSGMLSNNSQPTHLLLLVKTKLCVYRPIRFFDVSFIVVNVFWNPRWILRKKITTKNKYRDMIQFYNE